MGLTRSLPLAPRPVSTAAATGAEGCDSVTGFAAQPLLSRARLDGIGEVGKPNAPESAASARQVGW